MPGRIEKRGENKYLVRYFLGRDSQGKRKYTAKIFHGTKKDAARYLRDRLREKDLGLQPAPEPFSLEDFLEKWLKTVARPKIEKVTLHNYTKLAERVTKVLGKHQLAELKKMHIQQFYAELQEAEYATSTIRQTHQVLKAALQQAVDWELIPSNPCAGLKTPPVKRKERPVLTQEEVATFRAQASGTRYAVLFDLALSTGLRPEEFFALKWSDIDFQKGMVSVQRTMIREPQGGWYYGKPKSDRSRRTVPIPPSLVKGLQEHRRRQLEHKMKVGSYYRDHNLVFTCHNGEPVVHHNLASRYWKPLLKKAGLDQTYPLYTLRHTFCTLMIGAKVDLKTISERMGHSSVAFTIQTYGHVLPVMQQEATAQAEKIVFGTL